MEDKNKWTEGEVFKSNKIWLSINRGILVAIHILPTYWNRMACDKMHAQTIKICHVPLLILNWTRGKQTSGEDYDLNTSSTWREKEGIVGEGLQGSVRFINYARWSLAFIEFEVNKRIERSIKWIWSQQSILLKEKEEIGDLKAKSLLTHSQQSH